jgi:hypothetical protein
MSLCDEELTLLYNLQSKQKNKYCESISKQKKKSPHALAYQVKQATTLLSEIRNGVFSNVSKWNLVNDTTKVSLERMGIWDVLVEAKVTFEGSEQPRVRTRRDVPDVEVCTSTIAAILASSPVLDDSQDSVAEETVSEDTITEDTVGEKTITEDAFTDSQFDEPLSPLASSPQNENPATCHSLFRTFGHPLQFRSRSRATYVFSTCSVITPCPRVRS